MKNVFEMFNDLQILKVWDTKTQKNHQSRNIVKEFLNKRKQRNLFPLLKFFFKIK